MGIINKMVTVLDENKDWKVDIIGYTDNGHDQISNLKLSELRAKAAKEAIVKQGINDDRLFIIGKGESEPLNANSTSEEKVNNRRVAFIKK